LWNWFDPMVRFYDPSLESLNDHIDVAEGRANLVSGLFTLGRQLEGKAGYEIHSRAHVWDVTEVR